MKYIFFSFCTGYSGSDGCDVMEFPDDITDEELDQHAQEMAYEHAERYGYEICPDGDDCEDDECEFEHYGNTNISGGWEPYIPEKHDRRCPGGGSWL